MTVLFSVEFFKTPLEVGLRPEKGDFRRNLNWNADEGLLTPCAIAGSALAGAGVLEGVACPAAIIAGCGGAV